MIWKQGHKYKVANLLHGREGFDDVGLLRDRNKMDAESWSLGHGTHAPTLQRYPLCYLDNHVSLVVVKEIRAPTSFYIP